MSNNDMSDGHFILMMLFISLIVIYVLFTVDSNIYTREININNLNNTTSCTELQVYYNSALKFEYKFSENSKNIEKIQSMFKSKVNELDCN